MCCGILLVLHVGINSGVCYTMVVNLVLSFLVVDGRRRRSKGREGRREVAHRVRLFFFCECVSDITVNVDAL